MNLPAKKGLVRIVAAFLYLRRASNSISYHLQHAHLRRFRNAYHECIFSKSCFEYLGLFIVTELVNGYIFLFVSKQLYLMLL